MSLVELKSKTYRNLEKLAPTRWLLRQIVYLNPQKYWEGKAPTFPDEAKKDPKAYEEDARFLAEEIARLTATSVLEVGCGSGRVLKVLKERIGCKIVGVDFSETMLRNARDYIGDDTVELYQANSVTGLPFKDNAFDVVLTSDVLLHIWPKDAEKARAELIRVARKYIVHSEHQVKRATAFGYDNKAIYSKMGYRIAKYMINPHRPKSQRCEFVVIDVEQ